MRGQVSREDIQDDVQNAIGVQIEVANEAKGPIPCGTGASFNGLDGLGRIPSRQRMRRTQATCELDRELTIALRLFTKQIELVLLIAVDVLLESGSRANGGARTKDRYGS